MPKQIIVHNQDELLKELPNVLDDQPQKIEIEVQKKDDDNVDYIIKIYP
ncbi:hypothetical protein ACX1N0_03885 [Acinetobacter sp. ANC 4635]|nr:hypothetical protein [Acinetobacter sp. ANC 4635]